VEKLSGSLIGGSESRIVAAGLLLLLALIFGVWLSSTGRPLSVPLFTGHKLIALLILHRIAPILTPVAAAATIYLLLSGR
jgi:hypothetical protein